MARRAPIHHGPLPLSHQVARTGLEGLRRILEQQNLPKLIIAGAPRCGKSTLAQKIARDGRRYHHGEELVGLDWSAGSQKASEWLDEPGPWICENVAMARALRKWLARNPTGKPADLIVNLTLPVEERTPGQDAMAVGCETVMREILPELRKRGVTVLQARAK